MPAQKGLTASHARRDLQLRMPRRDLQRGGTEHTGGLPPVTIVHAQRDLPHGRARKTYVFACPVRAYSNASLDGSDSAEVPDPLVDLQSLRTVHARRALQPATHSGLTTAMPRGGPPDDTQSVCHEGGLTGRQPHTVAMPQPVLPHRGLKDYMPQRRSRSPSACHEHGPTACLPPEVVLRSSCRTLDSQTTCRKGGLTIGMP